MVRSIAALALVTAFCAACSDDGSPSPTAPSAATGAPAAQGPAGATSLNGCSTYAEGNTVSWSMSAAAPATCLKVKKGGSVTWSGDFGAHPLAPKGGDAPNPIAVVTSGSPKSVTFDAVGTFGFVCTVHSSMTGAISVVE